jgi:hypothetical protein
MVDNGTADAEDREYCCKVLMVSRGASIILEQPAAKALAKLFFMPTTHAASAVPVAVPPRTVLLVGDGNTAKA